ncbi:septum site-determining protein MinC [Jeotgalibacillus proteolyticus]|uniref:Probable septum site-determining protein MinC n=1 Tax=Jeotgalibacillus proteolyticus TaxID=2082395 RepID=A0A2S5GF92_9BACL|nr:septum site-determining protein MinC [Jeotgalibacillus proteolyticus]PPA71543.1 septum site-determining protein MinC [Jeotgalibacillus proteolyticus]
MGNRQNVMIKGTKDGFILKLDDQCGYEVLKEELIEKLSVQYKAADDQHVISAKIEAGNRYLSEEQQEELKEIVKSQKSLVVGEIHSNVITIDFAEQLIRQREMSSIAGIIRSGQVIEVEGDFLLIGDVNPGGMIRAGGNIYILGTLKGVAHAGCYGNEDAVIVASQMIPSQLRISSLLNRAPDLDVNEQESHEMECAYIDETEQIVVDRLQVLRNVRPDITNYRGGI